jgi:hydrogenase-4 component B
MSAAQLVLIGSGVLVLGAAVTALVSSRRDWVGPVALVFVLAASALILPAALLILAANRAGETGPLLTIPTLGAVLRFRVDQLSALFLLIICVVGALTTLYSVSYMRRYRDQHLIRYYPLLLLFFAGVVGVVCMGDWFFFLIFWEFMTICSYFLVIFEKENPAALRAGLKYVIMTHAATGLMLIAVIALWQMSEPHSFSFAAAKGALAGIAGTKPVLLHVLLALWFVGFGTKAGVLPFGDWLPDAYPAAPSGASAAFAGTMTNLGMYGLLRVFLGIPPSPEVHMAWGIVLAVFGAASIFVGTITALAQDDGKRLLAFQMIGQMGYVLLAVGAGIYLLSQSPAIAALAVMAGIFHLVNGACYKPLLFFNAGSILLRTGARNLNDVSGLWAIMPATGATALIASMAMAGMPPFNGFVSKWIIYHVTILGVPALPIFLLLGIVALFISLVTLASLLKFLGGAFLGVSSASEEQAGAGDVPFAMQIPQFVLGALCIGIGLVPMIALAGIHRAIGSLEALPAAPGLGVLFGESWAGLRLSLFGQETTGMWLPLAGLAALVLASLVAHGIARLGASERRGVTVWHCGAILDGERARYLVVEPKTEPATAGFEARYQAHGLYGAFKEAFRSIYPTVRPPRVAYPRRLMSVFDADTWLFQPLVRAGDWLTQRFSRTHSGVPQQYLIWQLLGLVLVVLVLALWTR